MVTAPRAAREADGLNRGGGTVSQLLPDFADEVLRSRLDESAHRRPTQSAGLRRGKAVDWSVLGLLLMFGGVVVVASIL